MLYSNNDLYYGCVVQDLEYVHSQRSIISSTHMYIYLPEPINEIQYKNTKWVFITSINFQ